MTIAVVKFLSDSEEGAVDWIPKVWLVGKYTCLWPPRQTTAAVINRWKKTTEEQYENWDNHDVEVLTASGKCIGTFYCP
jgi:hypothetical protein